MLSITSDYFIGTGDAAPYLRRIADAGFSHVHWCHDWDSDYVYPPAEMERVAKCFQEYGLKLLDLHGATGWKACWWSPYEEDRLAGVALVQNRIEMTARLGADVVVMHIHPGHLDPLRRSLDALQPFAREHGVRIAIENIDEYVAPPQLCQEYPADFVGLCYDSGHGNLRDGMGLDFLEGLKDRLLALHLHDNDGSADQHKLLFTGTVDWPRLARLIAHSGYAKCISMEVVIKNTGITDETVFLAKAFESGTRFTRMVDDQRK